MKIVRSGEIAPDIVREPGAKNATVQRLIDTPDGADRFVMSLFELGRDGTSPPHYHDWEHEIYVVSGTLRLELPDRNEVVTLKQGDSVFIARGEQHAFSTAEDESALALTMAPAERPPIRSVFLSEKPYQYDQPAAERR
jgi:quercetin dioxygenase-like cupin family protein